MGNPAASDGQRPYRSPSGLPSLPATLRLPPIQNQVERRTGRRGLRIDHEPLTIVRRRVIELVSLREDDDRLKLKQGLRFAHRVRRLSNGRRHQPRSRRAGDYFYPEQLLAVPAPA